MAERGAAGPHRRGHATDEQVQEAHEESVADQDYITPPATTEWSRLSPDEQARWTVRGQAAIRAWCAHINAPGDGTPERDAEWERFEYFESEIGALMRESSFWVDSRDIDADGTVEANEENPLGAPGALLDTLLRNMADQWAPSLRAPYVTALVRRFEADPRIPDAAMTLLRDAVTRVLGITP